MANKTLIGGTSYDISGGRCLVNGTGYNVKKGRTLVGGSGYNVDFISPAKVLDVKNMISNMYVWRLDYVNGYWVACGATLYNENAKIAYATSLNGPWTTINVTPANGYYYDRITSITYANGYWVAIGLVHQTSDNDSPQEIYVHYATSLNGPWSSKVLWSCVDTSATSCKIIYANGYWVVAGTYDSDADQYTNKVIIACTNNPTETWTIQTLWDETSSSVNDIIYANGYWVVVGTYYNNMWINGSLVEYDYGRIAYIHSQNPLGIWTIKDLWSSSNIDDGSEIYSVNYGNNAFFVSGYYKYQESTSCARVAYATTPDGEWTFEDLWEGDCTTYFQGNVLQDMHYANGYWVAVGTYYNSGVSYGRIAYRGAADQTYTTIDLWAYSTSYPPDYKDTLCDIMYQDGNWIFPAQYYSPDGSSTTRAIIYGKNFEEFDKLLE